ncbi:MAG: hypothetical protein AMXMBFR36_05870 [Acidobacteriota bacterium]
MTKSSGISCALAALLLAGCGLFGASAAERAEQRVRLVLDTVAREGEVNSASYHVAVCKWWKDKEVIQDRTEHEWAVDQFREFSRRGTLGKGLRYEILESEEIEGSNPAEVLVSGTLDGSPFELLVPEGKPLKWKKAPRPT